ncbi:elongation factor P, partial [Enterococcus cecorum]
MRMKLRDVRSGATYDTTFRPEEKFERAHIDTKTVQYLYTMDDTAYFMDLETYEQYEIPTETVETEMKYILENMEVKIQFFGSEVVGIQLPTTVVLKVEETQPSIKGATVTGSGKPATMETGLVVNVPDFIEAGEYLEINTAEGTYVKRATK